MKQNQFNHQKNHKKNNCDEKNGNTKKLRRNGFFWALMSVFSLLLVGTVTFALVLYEGGLLRKTIKENRAEVLEELRKMKKIDQMKGV